MAIQFSRDIGDTLILETTTTQNYRLLRLPVTGFPDSPAKDIKVSLSYPESDNREKPAKNTLKLDLAGWSPGLYLVDSVVPFIIRPETYPELVVVVPYLTWQAYSSEGGKSLFDYNSAGGKAALSVSLKRPVLPDQYTLSLAGWLTSNMPETGFIADQDLQHILPEEIKTLILFGYCQLFTIEMKRTLQSFLGRGGNLIVMSGAPFLHHGVVEDNRLSISEFSWKTQNPAGLLYCGTEGDSIQYSILEKDFPLFKGLDSTSVRMPAGMVSGFQDITETIIPAWLQVPESELRVAAEFNLSKRMYCHKSVIATYARGKGRILFIGADGFLLNLESKAYSDLLKNALSFPWAEN